MKLSILTLLLFFTSFASNVLAATAFAATTTKQIYTCNLVAGSGPFKSFELETRTDSIGRTRALRLDVIYTKESGRIYDEERITELSVRTLPELSNLTEQTIKILNVGDWGGGEINLGTDEYNQTTALVTFRSDSASNRGVYGCSVTASQRPNK